MKTNYSNTPTGETLCIEHAVSAAELARITKCNHEWVVFSTALQDVCLMLECVECGAFATVDDPSKEEWDEAFHAPENPYGWSAKSRVTVRGLPRFRHVERNCHADQGADEVDNGDRN